MRAVLATVFGVLLFQPGTSMHAGAAEVAPYVVVGDPFEVLRDAFNAKRGHVRLLFVVDSSCSICLRGMADLNDALLEHTSDPRLDTFIVHVPVIGGTAEHIGPSAELIHNARVTHYWNASGTFGDKMAIVADLKKGEERVYAWDVWMIYGSDVVWEGEAPPKPEVLMHQLPHLHDHPTYAQLDAEAFQDVRKRLEQLPTVMAPAPQP